MSSRFSDYRDIHAGQSIIVCGCGRSLAQFSHSEKYTTIGVNDIGRQFDPNYLVVLNSKRQFKRDRFHFVENSRAKALFTQLSLGIKHPNIVRFKLGKRGGTDCTDLISLPFTRNSPYVALCLAMYMGAKRIALIGVDFTEHHFFAKSGKHALSTNLKSINLEYQKLYVAARNQGIEIVNLSKESRITAFPKSTFDDFYSNDWPVSKTSLANENRYPENSLKIVSYSTMPVAGVPEILAACINQYTDHECRCVWATNDYGNGVIFNSDIEWRTQPQKAMQVIRNADIVIVHNGKVAPQHQSLLKNKPIVTMAHNYIWNVDQTFVKQGFPGVVVAQYQATLPEYCTWSVVPNPIILENSIQRSIEKNSVISISFTPSGKHDVYPKSHRLYWHSKGYASTMAILNKLAEKYPIKLEVIRNKQLSHAQVLAMKSRSHIVIDECVTGSYHRNSLEGLAAGCVVINGYGQLQGMHTVFTKCLNNGVDVPFISSDLQQLERTLTQLIKQGPDELVRQGAINRQWMEQNWSFEMQWQTHWEPMLVAAFKFQKDKHYPRSNHLLRRVKKSASSATTHLAQTLDVKAGVSVVIPHSGLTRLKNLLCALRYLKKCNDIDEIIVIESGTSVECYNNIKNYCDKYAFVYHDGLFQRGHNLNIGSGLSEYEYILWLDNDLLVFDGFVQQAVNELITQKLDFLVPYSSIQYLTLADSSSVLDGNNYPGRCTPLRTFRGGRDVIGGCGLLKRKFYLEHGGFENGFQGWGGEDNAWHLKAALFGKSGVSKLSSQRLFHLFHENSGSNRNVSGLEINPKYNENIVLLDKIKRIRSKQQYQDQFPASPFMLPWNSSKSLQIIIASLSSEVEKSVNDIVRELKQIYQVNTSIVRLEALEKNVVSFLENSIFIVFSDSSSVLPTDSDEYRQLFSQALLIYQHKSSEFHSLLAMESHFSMVMPFDDKSADAFKVLPERVRRYKYPVFIKNELSINGFVSAVSMIAYPDKKILDSLDYEVEPVVWVYWEGDCPDWIAQCHRTIKKHSPNYRILNAEIFDQLWYKDRDIEINKLPIALKADYMRAFLLCHFGGLWIDSDCIVMKPLSQLFSKLENAEFIAHRERSGLVSNAFIGAKFASEIARRYYQKVCKVLRSNKTLGWTSIGSQPLTEVLNASEFPWYELACEDIQPVCWSQPEAFFKKQDKAVHEEKLNTDSLCYMLSNQQISLYQKKNCRDKLLQADTFFRFLLNRVLNDKSMNKEVRMNKLGNLTHNRTQAQEVFRQIYKANLNVGDESVSGPGSVLSRTQVIRTQIPILFDKYKIRNILDAPCGDFNWFKKIVNSVDQYMGVDIVSALINQNNKRYASKSIRFRLIDVREDNLPEVDLIFSRDCLVHFPQQDIFNALRNIKRSGSRYLLMTTFSKPRKNRDINLGDWRPINFNESPYNLPPPIHSINEKCDEAGGKYRDKCLALWDLKNMTIG